MKRLVAAVLAVAGVLAAAAPPLAIVKPIISDQDGGAPWPADFAHSPGETMFFSFMIEGYTPSSAQKVNLTYKMDVFDPRGVHLVEPITGEIEDTLAPEDKDWKPIVRQQIIIPPLAGSGTYKIAIAVSDVIARKTATLDVPFVVHGHDVALSDTLVIRNIHFFRGENDVEPLLKPSYRPGDAIWVRFDMIGFKYGPGNAIDVSYDVSILAPGGKVMYSRPQANSDRSQSFYPKRYVPAAMSVSTKPDTRPGDYTIVLTAHDGVGHQTWEARQSFTIE